MPARKSAVKTFRAVLEQQSSGLRWTYVRIPFDAMKSWPERRGMRVRGEINGFPFRTALFPYPLGEGKMLLVNKSMQKGANARPGEKVEVRIGPDLEERPALLPDELVRTLKADRQLRKWFDGLGEYTRRMIGAWVAEPKSAESRRKRAEQMAERLFLTMEGELETPPVLKVAFQRQPLAEAGWKSMTLAQRRSHLLGIFYYRTAEGRQNRAAKTVQDALRVARMKSGSSAAQIDDFHL